MFVILVDTLPHTQRCFQWFEQKLDRSTEQPEIKKNHDQIVDEFEAKCDLKPLSTPTPV